MLFWEIIVVAIRGILANKLRTGLTMLGIIVGVGSVIVLLAYSAGTREDMLKDFERWGANRMGCWMDRWSSGVPIPQTESFTLDDTAAIRASCPSIDKVSAIQELEANVSRNTIELDAYSVIAIEPDWTAISNYQIDQGRFFTDDENLMRERVCVLASMTKEALFFSAPAVDEFITIDGKRFKVVGTYKPVGNSRWESHDERVLIPIGTAMDRVSGVNGIGSLNFRLHDPSMSERAEEEVRRLLHERHPRVPLPDEAKGQTEPFRFWNAAEWQARREESARTLTIFLGVVGFTSLLIGGVGVMNIMLVTVQERTREIGLRKALGATFSSVMNQFLLESIVICLLGGLIGTGIAVLACRMIARLPEESQIPPPIVTPMAIFVAASVTVAIGLFFGVYPAMRAAGQDPIRALRFQ
ncbi:ABC transporter permease [bacterium]|nr:ABC transporter permease [bacterium]